MPKVHEQATPTGPFRDHRVPLDKSGEAAASATVDELVAEGTDVRVLPRTATPVRADWEDGAAQWTGEQLLPIERELVGLHGAVVRFATFGADGREAVTEIGSTAANYAIMRGALATNVTVAATWLATTAILAGDLVWVSGTSGTYYIALSDHTAAAATTPGTTGGNAVWLAYAIHELPDRTSWSGVYETEAEAEADGVGTASGQYIVITHDGYATGVRRVISPDRWLPYTWPGGRTLHTGLFDSNAAAYGEIRSFNSSTPELFVIDGRLKQLTFYEAPDSGNETFHARVPTRLADALVSEALGEPNADKLGQIRDFRGSLYRCAMRSGVQPTVTWDVFGFNSNVGALWGESATTYSYKGESAVGGSDIVNPSQGDIFSTPGGSFEHYNVISGATIGWKHLGHPGNWRGRFETENLARHAVTKVGDVVVYGGQLRQVATFAAGTATHYLWEPYPAEDTADAADASEVLYDDLTTGAAGFGIASNTSAWQTSERIEFTRAITEADDGGDIRVFGSYTVNTYTKWIDFELDAELFRLMPAIDGSNADGRNSITFQIQRPPANNTATPPLDGFAEANLHFARWRSTDGNDGIWLNVGSGGGRQNITAMKLKVVLVKDVGGTSTGGGMMAEEESGVVATGDRFYEWTVFRHAATLPGIATLPRWNDDGWVGGSVSPWYLYDENPGTLGQDTSLPLWIGRNQAIRDAAGFWTYYGGYVEAAFDVQYAARDADLVFDPDGSWGSAVVAGGWIRFRLPGGDYTQPIPLASSPTLEWRAIASQVASYVGTESFKLFNVDAIDIDRFAAIKIDLEPFQNWDNTNNRNVRHTAFIPKPVGGWPVNLNSNGFTLVYRADEGIAWGHQGTASSASPTMMQPDNSGAWNDRDQVITFQIELDNIDDGYVGTVCNRFHTDDYGGAYDYCFMWVSGLEVAS